MSNRKLQWSVLIALSLTIATSSGSASTILGGLEDIPGSSGFEKNGDYNDLMFKLVGNVSFNAPGAVLSNLTAGVINESDTVFWDNKSLDGSHDNVGYFMPGFGANQYLATPTGGSANNVTFMDSGLLTITLLGGIAGNAPHNTIGWYDPSDPSVLHQLFSGVTSGTVTFTPTSQFALYSSDGRWGQVYSSISAANIGESGSQQHFAFFANQTSNVPEPSSVALAGLGLALIAAGTVRRRLRTRSTLPSPDPVSLRLPMRS